MSGYGAGLAPASATAARALSSSAATGMGSSAGVAGCVPGGCAGRCRCSLASGGQASQGTLPGGDAGGAGQHAEAERERLGARVQGSMA